MSISTDPTGMPHNIDFHSVTGPGGGAPVLLAESLGMKRAAFKLLSPGLFVYGHIPALSIIFIYLFKFCVYTNLKLVRLFFLISYHCAAAPVPMHIANGMYGLILVEPENGLSPVQYKFRPESINCYSGSI